MKLDEQRFLIVVASHVGTFPRDLIQTGKYGHYKRCWYMLDKWTRLGWYDYGVTADLGWLTAEGEAKARQVLSEAAAPRPGEEGT